MSETNEQHSAEPWMVGERYADNGADFKVIIATTTGAEVVGEDGIYEEDARRIVACVNFCAGVPDAELQDARLQTLLNDLMSVITQRDGNIESRKRAEEQRDQLRQRVAELEADARHPTLSECEESGKGPGNKWDGRYHEGGLPNTPEERARFEAYMRGHCWSIGAYDEAIRAYDTVDVRRLYGVWRDRGSLPTAAPAAASAPEVVIEFGGVVPGA